MNFVVDTLRQAQISHPEVYAFGETTPLVVTGLTSPDVATMKLALFDNSGNELALCSSFTAVTTPPSWTGDLNCNTEIIQSLMQGQLPDYRLPVYAILVDKNRVWFAQNAMMVNNPLVIPPYDPNPALVYLTTSDFATLPNGDITNVDALFAMVIAMRNALKG